ncbi:hypothetical protein [Spirosoma montaniterrae]|uniref:Uncharacterized protein n=1 Tax=Spirosoma montaniterrae TaxID=1178516 RepID=A0A1P9X407_9BACT|nr:hypothetical protein [Spirosoma montaniterrae]AQG82328.1 hypothetical protein AWR27_05045 [Spirosoma montaniterrae]
MNRNRRIFIAVFVLFTALVILVTIDMASQTTAPWNKRKQAERAFKRDGVVTDSVANDTLLLPKK